MKAYLVETPEGWEVALGSPLGASGLLVIGEGDHRAIASGIVEILNDISAETQFKRLPKPPGGIDSPTARVSYALELILTPAAPEEGKGLRGQPCAGGWHNPQGCTHEPEPQTEPECLCVGFVPQGGSLNSVYQNPECRAKTHGAEPQTEEG